MRVAEAPLISGTALAAAYKVGRSVASSERTLRTLRLHGVVTSGLVQPVPGARGGRFAGRVTLYSVLNRDAVALARSGYEPAARRLARSASQVERSGASRELAQRLAGCFERVAHALAELPDTEKRVYASYALLAADPEAQKLLRSASALVEHARQASQELSLLDQRTAACVVRLAPAGVVLRLASGEEITVPREMLAPRGLDVIGAPLMVHREALPSGDLLVSAFPAVDLDARPAKRGVPFDPPADAFATSAERIVTEIAPLLREWAAASAPASARAS